MTVPSVQFRVLNGKLGVQKPGGIELDAYVGPCDSGDFEKPTRHSRQDDLMAVYGGGPTPELAIRAVENYGAEAVMVRAHASVDSDFGTLDDSGVTGSSAVSLDPGATSDDDYEVVVTVIKGGVISADDGKTYKFSLDNGRTFSAPTALGVATSITLPATGGIKFNFAPGDLNAGDTFSILAKAPAMNSSDLSSALDSLKFTQHEWLAAWIATPIDASMAAVITTFLADLEASTGRSRKVYASLRMPDPGESESDYLDSVSAAFSGVAEKKITCCAAAARVVSARTGRPLVQRRPVIFAISGLPQSLPLGVDMSQTVDATPGGLKGVSIYDESGNNVEHDEMLHPGLDDARFLALRTWPDKTGVYVNNPTTLEGAGLDFHLDQFVRILCAFCNSARLALVDEVSRELDLNLKDNGPNKAGAPTERECQRIDSRVQQAILGKLKGQVTAIQFAMHRDDNILSTQTLNADGGIIFFGYPKLIVFTVSAINPAAV